LTCKHGHVNRSKYLVGLGLVILATLLIFSVLPLGTAFEFGDDESYEVIKAFMCSKGYRLYTEIWNDQPPVSTVLLTAAFKISGPSILTARLVAAGFGLVLIAAFHELVQQRSGQWAALLASFFLLASPGVLLLSVSVMLEVPAIGTGLVSAWLLFQWSRHWHCGWLLASAVLMGVALQIKLTAALVAPAMMVELWLMCRADRNRSWRKGIVISTLLWGVAVITIFVAIGLTWGRGSLMSSWKSHTATQVVAGYGRAADYGFEPRLLLNHLECVFAAVVCLLTAAWRRRLREIAFPLALLVTASVIHAVHRPWWNYYYLHLAVPLAWLTGWILALLVQHLFDSWPGKLPGPASAGIWKALALCVLAALPVARSERRLEGSAKHLRRQESAAGNPVVKKMKEHAARTKWVYSESGIYPFHAHLIVLPELAIIMPKRFWSGQISTRKIVETCKRYQPEMIMLPRASATEEWKELLGRHYVVEATDKACVLYLAKRLRDGAL